MAKNHNSIGGRIINSLPEDLLLTILLSLTTVEAIRTCVLSPMWCDLWTRLPKLSFNDNETSTLNLGFANLVDAAVTRASDILNFFEIQIANAANLDVPRLASWSRAVAPRITGLFKIIVAVLDADLKHTVLDLPCFPRARYIFLSLSNMELRLPMPSTGNFAFLNILDLFNLRFGDGGASMGELISSSCPQLQYLRLFNVIGVKELNIQSKQLLKLDLFLLHDLERLHVVAMKLLVFMVSCCYMRKGRKDPAGTELIVIAPMLNMVAWEGFCPEEMRFDANKHLETLSVCEFSPTIMWLSHHTNYARIMEHFSHSDCLKLFITFPMDVLAHKRLMEEMRLPRYLELELYIARNGHTIGSTLVSLLKRYNDTKKLTCVMLDRNLEPYNQCLSECMCDQPATWRDQKISFDSLEHLEFYNFMGIAEETDFIYFICEHSSVLKTVSITFSKHPDSSDVIDDLWWYLPKDCELDVSVMQ